MRAAIASAACVAVLIFTLAVRGADDWSRSFAFAWYGTLAAAVILGASGLITSATDRGASAGKRALIVAVALPAFIVTVMIVYAIVVVVPRVT